MLKNIIFDIGNVLMGFDADNYGREYFTDPLLAQKLQTAINDFHLWDKCDLCLEPVENIIEDFARSLPELTELARNAIFASIDYVRYADYAIPWLQELHAAGYCTYYLSNYNKYLMDKRPEILDFLPYMDGGIFSCNVHLIKPDPAIFSALCEKYRLRPDECVFLDDRSANIAAAQAFGMQGILVKNHAQAYQDLHKLLHLL